MDGARASVADGSRGQLELAETSPGMLVRMPALMAQYRDLPMDLADASLVALAEEERLQQIFTLDSNRVYRRPDGDVFGTIPDHHLLIAAGGGGRNSVTTCW